MAALPVQQTNVQQRLAELRAAMEEHARLATTHGNAQLLRTIQQLDDCNTALAERNAAATNLLAALTAAQTDLRNAEAKGLLYETQREELEVGKKLLDELRDQNTRYATNIDNLANQVLSLQQQNRESNEAKNAAITEREAAVAQQNTKAQEVEQFKNQANTLRQNKQQLEEAKRICEDKLAEALAKVNAAGGATQQELEDLRQKAANLDLVQQELTRLKTRYARVKQTLETAMALAHDQDERLKLQATQLEAAAGLQAQYETAKTQIANMDALRDVQEGERKRAEDERQKVAADVLRLQAEIAQANLNTKNTQDKLDSVNRQLSSTKEAAQKQLRDVNALQSSQHEKDLKALTNSAATIDKLTGEKRKLETQVESLQRNNSVNAEALLRARTELKECEQALTDCDQRLESLTNTYSTYADSAVAEATREKDQTIKQLNAQISGLRRNMLSSAETIAAVKQTHRHLEAYLRKELPIVNSGKQYIGKQYVGVSPAGESWFKITDPVEIRSPSPPTRPSSAKSSVISELELPPSHKGTTSRPKTATKKKQESKQTTEAPTGPWFVNPGLTKDMYLQTYVDNLRANATAYADFKKTKALQDLIREMDSIVSIVQPLYSTVDERVAALEPLVETFKKLKGGHFNFPSVTGSWEDYKRNK